MAEAATALVTGAPARAASPSKSVEPRAGSAPWLLSAPALLLFLGLLVIPLALTAVLSLHSFDGTRGVLPDFTARNYLEVFSTRTTTRSSCARPAWRWRSRCCRCCSACRKRSSCRA